MQIFEAIELREFPYFLTVDVTEGEIVGDVINDYNSYKVYLLVDHDTKRIWIYNGPNSSFKLQIYGGILASMLRKQLRLFYRVYPLNIYPKDDPHFQEIMEKQIAGGRAKTIDKEDFSEKTQEATVGDIIIRNPRFSKAIENINEVPKPVEFKRVFLIIGGTLYSEEETTEAFLNEEKTTFELVKMGRLNNGFTFFNDRNYSTRLIVKDRSIQGIELFINDKEQIPTVELKIPVIEEEKISRIGNIESLINAFKIPNKSPDEDSEHKNLQNDT
ncbi:MAG: hypothetical protein ACFE8J_14590 [Candidatus Heimdallarchaeota archaeon]